MKKLLSMIIVAVLAVTCFACKSPFNDEELGLEKVEGKITISIGIRNDSTEKAAMIALKKAFENENPLINIKIAYIQSSYHQGMSAYIGKPTDMPDIIWTAGDYYSPYSSQGIFVDLANYYAQDASTSIDKYVDSIMDLTHYGKTGNDSGIYFAPRDYNKPTTFVNKDIFAAAGVTIPTANEWNYAKLIEVSNALRVAMDNNTDQAKEAIGLNKFSFPIDANLQWQPVYEPVMNHFGGHMINTDSSVNNDNAIQINSDENVAALNNIYNSLVNNKLAVNPADGTDGLFIKSKAAMWFDVRPNLPSAIAQKINVEFLPFPFDYVGAGCSGFAITNQANTRKTILDGNNVLGNTNELNNEQLAWQFVKFIITNAGQEIMGKTGIGVPVLKSLINDSSSEWRKYSSNSLNHMAFVANEDNDINLNVVSRFPSTSQILIMSEINTSFSSAMLAQYHSSANALKDYLTSQKIKMQGYLA